MFKTKKYSLILLLISLIGCFMMANSVNAQAVDILDIEFESVPLFDEADFLPGDYVERYVIVENVSPDAQSVAAKATNISDPDYLATVMNLTVYEDGVAVYAGTLNEFFLSDAIFLSDLEPAEIATYFFRVTLDTDDNIFQNTTLSFDIIIGEGTGESFSGEGETDGGSPSGGSGYTYSNLEISNVASVPGETSALITWDTNLLSTSRVIYDIVSHSDLSGTSAPNYGYTNSTPAEDTPAGTNGVLNHDVLLSGLLNNTTYYYRAISAASPETKGEEYSFTTGENPDEPDLVIVKGIEGPTVDGQKIYNITVENNGNSTASNVVLTDTLPEGFVFPESGENKKEWLLGDIEPGEYKSISYMVEAGNDLDSGIYENNIEVKAMNHEPVSLLDGINLKRSILNSLTGGNQLIFSLGIILIFIVLTIIILYGKKKRYGNLS